MDFIGKYQLFMHGFRADPVGLNVNPGGPGNNPDEKFINPDKNFIFSPGSGVDPGGLKLNPGGFAADPGGLIPNPVGFVADPGGLIPNPGGFIVDPGGLIPGTVGFELCAGGKYVDPPGIGSALFIIHFTPNGINKKTLAFIPNIGYIYDMIKKGNNHLSGVQERLCSQAILSTFKKVSSQNFHFIYHSKLIPQVEVVVKRKSKKK